MKLALQLTLDGMVRALRMRAHELADYHQEARRRDAIGNERALTLLAAEGERFAEGADDELRH
jgi:hypothetical protein